MTCTSLFTVYIMIGLVDSQVLIIAYDHCQGECNLNGDISPFTVIVYSTVWWIGFMYYTNILDYQVCLDHGEVHKKGIVS